MKSLKWFGGFQAMVVNGSCDKTMQRLMCFQGAFAA
jgi:hypothetical protein